MYEAAGGDVAPFAGAWIEIKDLRGWNIRLTSLPSRERGLKYGSCSWSVYASFVAPFAGAWIEITPCCPAGTHPAAVAPFAGAWIEIGVLRVNYIAESVAPFAGAWIEIT